MPTAPASPKYKRVLLKISGEALKNDRTGDPIDAGVLNRLAEDIKEIRRMGVQVSIVVGGGNIFRGLAGRTTRAPTAPRATTWACSPP